MNAKTQQDVELIIEEAKGHAAPYLELMGEITKWSMPTAVIMLDGLKITYSHESDPVFLEAKRIVEQIFKDAQDKINK